MIMINAAISWQPSQFFNSSTKCRSTKWFSIKRPGTHFSFLTFPPFLFFLAKNKKKKKKKKIVKIFQIFSKLFLLQIPRIDWQYMLLLLENVRSLKRGRHDMKNNDTQHNDTQNNAAKQNNTQHNDT
jgi:hypothetical protein